MPMVAAPPIAALLTPPPIVNDTGSFPVDTVLFATPELFHHIIHNIVDVNSLSEITSLCLVSKQFHQTLTSDTVWRELCLQRWKGKWGFGKRWKNAVEEYDGFRQSKSTESADSADTKAYWMKKFKAEEIDSKRHCITGSELQDLVFDFRFWIGQPTVMEGRIIVQSGLIESAANQLRFKAKPDEEVNEWWSAQGIITGHPLRTQDQIEWFLNEKSGVIQWGIVPNLWPEGSVKRLESWGWEIRNCNVVMRAIDTDFIESNKGADVLTKAEEANSKLWKDLLDDIESTPLRNTPMVNGFVVTAEIPRSYLNQFTL